MTTNDPIARENNLSALQSWAWVYYRVTRRAPHEMVYRDDSGYCRCIACEYDSAESFVEDVVLTARAHGEDV